MQWQVATELEFVQALSQQLALFPCHSETAGAVFNNPTGRQNGRL